MIDEELERAMRGQDSDEDSELLKRLEEGHTLPAEIEQRYMDMGRHLLADESPRSIDDPTRERLERMLGRSLRDVRVHTGERAEQAAESLGAQAFALGDRDVFFGRGAYSPGSREGLGLLAHEIAHTVEATTPGATQVGFKGGPSGTGPSGNIQGEAYAEAVEGRVLAEEDSGRSPAAAQAAAPPAPSKSADKSAYVNAEYVEREAWKKLRERMLRERDQFGGI